MYAFQTDVETFDEKIRCSILLLLTLLIILPSTSGYIDCRISCRRCHENTEHPSVLEVYCAMCEECKQRRRERMQGRTTSSRTTGDGTPLVRVRDATDDSSEGLFKSPPITPPQPPPPVVQYTISQYQPPPPRAPSAPKVAQREAYDPALIGWPTGCPTPPTCSDSEGSDDTERLVYSPTPLPTTTPTTTTTPVPTTPCPPVPVCKKKKKKTMMPMMPCMPCMPMCPCPMYTYPSHQNLMMTMTTTTAPTTQIDYHYVYIGLPKNALSS